VRRFLERPYVHHLDEEMTCVGLVVCWRRFGIESYLLQTTGYRR